MIARRCVSELETQTALAGSLMVQCQLGIMTVAWKTVDRYAWRLHTSRLLRVGGATACWMLLLQGLPQRLEAARPFPLSPTPPHTSNACH